MIETQVMTITPEIAAQFLTRNVHNRAIRPTLVTTLAKDIRRGQWMLNGETIKISETSKLLDGQHRLLAVVEGGVGIETLVVTGLPDEAQDTIDIGLPRKFSDILHLAGEPNSTNLAAAIRFAWLMDNFSRPAVTGVVPTVIEKQDWLARNPDIRQSIGIGQRIAKGALRYPPSAAIGLHYLMGKRDHRAATEFWEALADGTERIGSPVYVLRETLLRDLTRPHRMEVIHRVALTIKAWNAWRIGETMKAIGFRTSGPTAEDYPTIQ